MPRHTDSYSQSHFVTAKTLTPQQQRTPQKLETKVDFYQQHMLKHPGLSDFHSSAEWLHAGLLEGDPTVPFYVPQPYLLRLRGEYYTPDGYFIRLGEEFVVELKPRGEFPDDKRIPLEQFFAQHGKTFLVISNESVLAKWQLAMNWVEIVRILYRAHHFDTESAERDVLLRFRDAERLCLRDVVDPGDRERTYVAEIALLRLLHRGLLTADLDTTPLDYPTEFSLCT